MAKLGPRGLRLPVSFHQPQPRVEPDLPESDDHSHVRELGDLGFEMVEASLNLFGCWFVVRRRASDRRKNVGVPEHETIVGASRGRYVGKPGRLERGHQEIA